MLLRVPEDELAEFAAAAERRLELREHVLAGCGARFFGRLAVEELVRDLAARIEVEGVSQAERLALAALRDLREAPSDCALCAEVAEELKRSPPRAWRPAPVSAALLGDGTWLFQVLRVDGSPCSVYLPEGVLAAFAGDAWPLLRAAHAEVLRVAGASAARALSGFFHQLRRGAS